MNNLKALWLSFKNLKWYEKIIFFIPFIFIIVLLVLYPQKILFEDSNKTIMKHSKTKTDNEVSDFKSQLKESKKELDQINKTREVIAANNQLVIDSYSDSIDIINNCPDGELSSVANHLRKNRLYNDSDVSPHVE